MSVWQIAIETSGRQGSVALLRQDVSIREIVLDSQARTAQTIGPAIEAVLGILRSEGHPLGFVSVTNGPGSFTGLRIGVTAAKALAFTVDCPIVACDTLALMIQQVRSGHQSVSQEPAFIDAAMNAYRGQVFCRRESFTESWQGDSRVLDHSDWLTELTEFAQQNTNSDSGKKILLAGDVWQQRADVPANLLIVEAKLWQPSATELGKMAWPMYQSSQFQDCLTLVPNYLRESAAVEKRNSQGQASASASAS